MVTQKEEKERAKTRREKIGCYFLDLSKLAFAGFVVGGLSPAVVNQNTGSIIAIVLGAVLTTLSGTEFLNKKHHERTYFGFRFRLDHRRSILRMASHQVGQEMVGRSRQVTAICQMAERAKAPINGGFSYSMLLLTCSILSPIAIVPVMHPSIFAFCCFFIGFLFPILSTSSTALS